jgi:predicted signal transduction protein with EAL and GGDEF domain
MALFEAKSAGRRRSVLYDADLEHRLSERRSLEADLRCALANEELEVHYQPFHDIATRRVTGYEALVRWRHPTRGMVLPSLFVPIAEETGLIVAIGEWVLHEALAEAAHWPEEITIAVNVSPAQMHSDTLARQVIYALAASGVAPHRLELEITETLLIHDSEPHRRLLNELRLIGVRIALDDFGTGYSSLNYLRSFPFDKLKIDRSFVKDLVGSADCRSIVATVLSLARRFRMETIAEGIEDEAQLAVLAELGCEFAQGFLFSEALPADALEFEEETSSG